MSTVYHYCSLCTFQSIIENKNIRLSELTKSNDPQEGILGFEDIPAIFSSNFLTDERANSYSYDLRETCYELCAKNVARLSEFGLNGLRYYGCCFSENGDLLSQWRAYADDGCGVAIGFNLEKLIRLTNLEKKSIFDFDCLLYSKMEYDEKRIKDSKEIWVNEMIEEIDAFIIENNIAEIQQHELNQTDSPFTIGLGSIFKKHCEKIFLNTLNIKSDFFQEEQEVRIWFMDSEHCASTSDGESMISDVKYYVRNQQLIPYRELSFGGEQVIETIILGPKCKVSFFDMSYFLQNANIECDVQESSGTYR